jgi:ribonuclease P protein subunit RPR2
MSRRHLGKKDARGLAGERVARLFSLAEEEAVRGNDERARKYVSLALRMGERHKVPASSKRRYCPECHSYFIPPRNVRVRVRKGMVAMTCLVCGKVQRFPTVHRMRG